VRGKLSFSNWLYGALLYLYPKKLRVTYGPQMRLTFGDACRAAYQRNGAGGLLALWLPTLLDLFKSALAERTRQGELTMSKARLIALAGPLTILVGALWLMSALGALVFQTGLIGDETLLGVVLIPLFLSIVPQLFALIGARLRFHSSAGALGRFGLTVSVAGGAGLIVAVLLVLLLGEVSSGGASIPASGLWVSYAAFASFMSIRFGYLLFGVEALRTMPLPRWNLLPLLVGLSVVLSLAIEWFGAPAFLPSQWAHPFLHFALTGAGWVLLGIAMLDHKREPQPAPAI